MELAISDEKNERNDGGDFGGGEMMMEIVEVAK